MQYILTESEYMDLKRDYNEKLRASNDNLQRICTLAAQHIPVPCDWGVDKTPRPWGCVLGEPAQDPGCCDDCPVMEICPNPHKEWSK